MSMLYWIYNLLLNLATTLTLPFLPFLFLLRPRMARGLGERLGCYPRHKRAVLGGAHPVWIHAASVGEVNSAAALARALRREFPRRKILFSTVTTTGQEICRRVIKEADLVIYLPLDHPLVVARVLRRFSPCMLILLETEIWPNLLRAAHTRRIPVLLLSGRISVRSVRRYARFRRFFSGVLSQVTVFGMQSSEDGQRLARIGAAESKIRITGNLKYATDLDCSIPPPLDGVLDGERRILVVGSTHRGEEELFLNAFTALKAEIPGLLMIVAPRHPERFQEVEDLLRARGIHYGRKSQLNGGFRGLLDVILLDTMGDLPATYALADVAFVGGSIVDAGGHNLIEPAFWSKPVVFGPHTNNFADVAGELKAKGGGVEVAGLDDIVREFSSLLQDKNRATQMGRAAHAVVKAGPEVVPQAMELVRRWLPSEQRETRDEGAL